MEKPIRIRILDHEYLLRSDEDEERVKEIAAFVNVKLREVRDSAGSLSEGKAAILAAFHVASDYFQVLKERDALIREVQGRARILNQHIDTVSENS
ncbi:MAG: cell division protein ZapA [Deltaproteobacteria bacterium]|jgi:cell division protein ZapA|nr:cell division protein ZapA [Deltaproteobacteria bacterium]